MQGEVSVNEWHDHFLAHGARRTSLMSNKPLPSPPSAQPASIQSIVQHWTGLAQRRRQVSSLFSPWTTTGCAWLPQLRPHMRCSLQDDDGNNDVDLDGRHESELSVEVN